MITLKDVFTAYYDCRKNKRKTTNQLQFELNYEANLLKLYEEIINQKYKIWKTIVFVVKKPVQREIFAWDFRDRVVHHLIMNKINSLFEKEFIYDTYSCRKWRWTMFWINRATKFMRQVSENYKKEAYTMKLDISWFFMNIDRNLLYKNLELFLKEKYKEDDLDLLLYLIKEVVYNDCTKNCIIKWHKKDWFWLPKNKSLFYVGENRGMPIWNLTSQIFWNFYLNKLDHFIKSKLKARYYGRYVDDMIFFHKNKNKLLEIKNEVNNFLQKELFLELNLKKTFIWEIQRGVLFLWIKIMPFRNIVWKRLKANFKDTIYKINKSEIDLEKVRSSLNSYLWIYKHYSSYKLKKKIMLSLKAKLYNHIYISWWYNLIKMKRKQVF